MHSNGSKGINTNELLLSDTLDGSGSSRVELPSKDEDNVKILRDEYQYAMVVIKKLSIEINKITTVCKYQEKILHICDEKEKELKEEIISLRT